MASKSSGNGSMGGNGVENLEKGEQLSAKGIESGLRKQFFDALKNENDLPNPQKAREVLDKMREEGDRFTKEELNEYQEMYDAAEEHEKILQELKDIGKYPLSRINMLLSRAQIYRTRLMEPMSEVQEIRGLLTNEEVHRRNKFLQDSNKELRRHYDELVKVCEQTEMAAKNMDFLHKTGLAMYRDKTMTYNTLVRRLDHVEKTFANFHEKNKVLPAVYLEQVPVLKMEFFEEGKGVEHKGLSQLIQFRKAMKVFHQLGKQLPSINKLRSRLADDMGIKATDLRFDQGAIIKLNGKVGKIMGIDGDVKHGGQILVDESGGVIKLSPAEFYFHLLTESGYLETMDSKPAVKGAEYIPAIQDLDSLENLLRTSGLPEGKHLEKVGRTDKKGTNPNPEQSLKLPKNSGNASGFGKTKDNKDTVVIRSVFEDSKGGAIIAIDEIDEDKKTVTYISGYSEDQDKKEKTFKNVTTASYQEFYQKINDPKFKFEYKTPETDPDKPYWSISPWSAQVTTKPDTWWPRFSIAAGIKAFKKLSDRFDRVGDDRRDWNAANLTKLMAKQIDKLPWCGGIYNAALTEENNFIISKVKKWSEEYQSAFKTDEFEKTMKKFHHLPKLRQAALLLAAGTKGMTKAEVYHLLNGESYENAVSLSTVKKTTHNDYRGALFEYFCKDGAVDSLPRRYESVLTPTLDQGYDKQYANGYKDSVSMVSPDDILDMHASYIGKFVPDEKDPKKKVWRSNNTKRMRIAGTTESLLKYGTSGLNMGKQVFWSFGLVGSSEYADKKGYFSPNNMAEVMMRRVGNFGKGTVPMLGLFRFPQGMAHARAMIDWYIHCTGEDPFIRNSDGERMMGHLFSGRFSEAENQLKAKIGDENCERMKWLYLKARFTALRYEEGADFSYKYGNGGYLDETMLGDAYGVSGMLSKQWLETILATDNNGDPKHAIGVHMNGHGTGKDKTGWWQMIGDAISDDPHTRKGRPNKFDEVTLDERKMFAVNMAESLQDGNEMHYYWRNRGDIILNIYDKYLVQTPGKEKITFVDTEQKTWQADNIKQVKAHLVKKKKERGIAYGLTYLKVPESWFHDTEHTMSGVAQGVLKGDPGYSLEYKYDRNIQKMTKDLIDRSEAAVKVKKDLDPPAHHGGHGNIHEIRRSNRDKMRQVISRLDKQENEENHVNTNTNTSAVAL